MKIGNAAFDLAELRAEQEREAAIGAAGRLVSAAGSDDCLDCCEPIEAMRKAAAPFAKRCIGCQEAHERELKGI